MRNRRFVLLAGVLVALNLALWIAPQGLALRQIVIAQLFGPKLVRADVVTHQGSTIAEWRVDRGVISQVSETQVTLHEVDGHIQTIALSPATQVYGLGKVFTVSSLAPGWRVLVTWRFAGSADSVKVERRGSSSQGNGPGSHG